MTACRLLRCIAHRPLCAVAAHRSHLWSLDRGFESDACGVAHMVILYGIVKSPRNPAEHFRIPYCHVRCCDVSDYSRIAPSHHTWSTRFATSITAFSIDRSSQTWYARRFTSSFAERPAPHQHYGRLGGLSGSILRWRNTSFRRLRPS